MTAITMLVGAEVSGISFVRDYVDVHFDGPILRALSSPNVKIAGTEFQFPFGGSRDGLCMLIGKTVLAAREDARFLTLEFDGSGFLRIPLVTSELGPEAAHLVPISEGRLDVSNMAIWESIPE